MRDPKTMIDDPLVVGAIDRSLVDEVVRRHLNQLRYCYQRELTRQPTLAGKVVVHFTISKDGSVSSSRIKTSTMNYQPVESCMVRQFLRMQFPKPKGGGFVVVSYPFLFSPG